MLADEGDGVIGQVIRHVAIAGHDVAVAVHHRVEVVAPMAGGEPVKFVKSAAVWVVGVLRSVVPLAEASGGIACGLQHVGQRLFPES